VGKSTLLSAATGLELKTGEISRKISRGRHTTRHAELLFSGDYQVLDTPGFSLLEPWEGLEPIRLKDDYPDFAPYEGQCRFSPCYHLSEPGCAVLEAMENGELGRQRVERYHILLKRVQEIWRKRYD
jgi:ribosome biogenesis GTPase